MPRRRAPWAILQALAAAAAAGSFLILFGILAVSDPALPELRTISGGLPFLVKNVLGEKLGILLLVEVIFAVFVCVLAVHAASVRLIFAMARDNNLPFAGALSHVSPRTRAPVVPARCGRHPGRGDPDLERQPSQCHRDALLRRHHLGQPGVPHGDASALALPALASPGGPAGSGQERDTPTERHRSRPPGRSFLFLDGPLGASGQHDRRRCGGSPS